MKIRTRRTLGEAYGESRWYDSKTEKDILKINVRPTKYVVIYAGINEDLSNLFLSTSPVSSCGGLIFTKQTATERIVGSLHGLLTSDIESMMRELFNPNSTARSDMKFLALGGHEAYSSLKHRAIGQKNIDKLLSILQKLGISPSQIQTPYWQESQGKMQSGPFKSTEAFVDMGTLTLHYRNAWTNLDEIQERQTGISASLIADDLRLVG